MIAQREVVYRREPGEGNPISYHRKGGARGIKTAVARRTDNVINIQQ